MQSISCSPYSIWCDIAITNKRSLADALHKLEQCLAHIRENLKTSELRDEFDRANRFRLGEPRKP